MPFLSICVCTIHPDNMIGLLENLRDTAADPASFEVLICVDEGDAKTLAALNACRLQVRFRVIEVPKRDGYYSLHRGYEALRAAADCESYFIWQISDEVRLASKGWDTVLKSYIGLFPDNLFRLRLSLNKYRNYYQLYDCLPYPENYFVATRAWHEATGGSGDFWGPDSWHQCIDYFLGLLRNPYAPYGRGVFRSIPVSGIALANEEAGQGLTGGQSAARQKRIKRAYRALSGLTAQEHFLQLAQQVNLHIWMHAYRSTHPECPPLAIKRNTAKRVLTVVEERDPQSALYRVSYAILPFRTRLGFLRLRRGLTSLGLIAYLRARLREKT
jgi:hypothetical protein